LVNIKPKACYISIQILSVLNLTRSHSHKRTDSQEVTTGKSQQEGGVWNWEGWGLVERRKQIGNFVC